MMQRILKFILAFCCFLSVSSVVYADDEGDETQNSSSYYGIAYDIRQMTVDLDKQEIKFSGFGLREKNNNNHGHISSISMVAVSTTDTSKQLIAKPSGAANGTRIEVQNDGTDYYVLNCLKGIPSYGDYDDKDNAKGCPVRTTAKCSEGNCTLKNLGFTAVFKFSDLKKSVGDAAIFYLRIGVNPNNVTTQNKDIADNMSVNFDYGDVPIAVYNGKCNIISNGESIACQVGDTTVSSGNGDIGVTLSGLTNKARVITSLSKPQSLTQNNGYTCYGKGKSADPTHYSCNCYYIQDSEITITGFDAEYRDFYGFKGQFFYEVKMERNSLKDKVGGGCAAALNGGRRHILWSWMQMEGIVGLQLGEIKKPAVTEEKVQSCDNSSIVNSRTDTVDIRVSGTWGTGKCRKTMYATMSAKYKVVETGDLVFDIDRGPIYDGGHFKFSYSYENVAVWSYVGTPNACPSIYIPYPKESRCCTPAGCRKCCVGGAYVSPDTKYVSDNAIKLNGAKGTYNAICDRGNLELAKNHYEYEIAKVYRNPNSDIQHTSTSSTEFPDSNKIDNPRVNNAGEWMCYPIVDSNGNKIIFSGADAWRENNERISRCQYKLYDSYIDKHTSFVEYHKNPVESPYNYLNKKGVYFIPLKWQDKYFNFSVKANGISSLKGTTNGKLDLKCSVETLQRLYDDDRDESRFSVVGDDGDDLNKIMSNEVSFMYFYRPIILSDVFPNERNAGVNWITWIEKKDNVNRLLETYKNMEYKFDLTKDMMNKIHNYNVDKIAEEKKLGYLDYDELELNGSSMFFKNVGLENLNKKSSFITYQPLGLFDEKKEVAKK